LRLLLDGPSLGPAPVPVRSRVVIAQRWPRRGPKILAGLLGRIFGGCFELRRLDFRFLGGISDEAYELGQSVKVRRLGGARARDRKRTKYWSSEGKDEQQGYAENGHDDERSPFFPAPPGVPTVTCLAVVVNQTGHRWDVN
jgi:hypothetical protein